MIRPYELNEATRARLADMPDDAVERILEMATKAKDESEARVASGGRQARLGCNGAVEVAIWVYRFLSEVAV